MGGREGFWEPFASVAQAGVLTFALTVYVAVELWRGLLPGGSVLAVLLALVVGVGGGVGFAFVGVSRLSADPLDEYVFLVTVVAIGLVAAKIVSPVGVPAGVTVGVLAFLWTGVGAKLYFEGDDHEPIPT
ncbi:hypothetical protein [Halorientalis halophila]|uniref:hypothetical protein n=1 Tax=Halorientalis halophila TaxID=3108499 RepID=UPI00300AC0C9